jgi:histidine triad (HIT) family protein
MTSQHDSAVDDCRFCAIARGEDEVAEIVCEGSSWVAFFPLSPATPGHTLVVPRPHVVDLWKIEPSLGADLMAATIRVGRAIERALKPEGMNLISSAGATAEQSVFHLHLHIVPRWRRDGFGKIWPPVSHFADDELIGVAERIRAEC